jgi:hypothetical protein
MADEQFRRVEVPGMGQVEFPASMTDEQIVSVIQTKLLKPAPSTPWVGVNAINKGIAGTADLLLNAPQNFVNLGKAFGGTLATAAGRPDLAPTPTPPPDFATRAFKATGMIRPELEPVNAGQRIVEAVGQGVGGGVMMPTASLAGALRGMGAGAISGAVGQGTTEATGSPTAGAITGMATPFAMSAAGARAKALMDEQALRKAEQSVRDRVLASGQEAGYVVPPSTVNPSFLNKRLEGIAGKAATGQETSLRNQETTNRLMAKELGLPPGTPITEGELNKFRENAAKPYREIADISLDAKSALNELKQARFDSKLYWNSYNRTGDPAAYKQAQKLDSEVATWEKVLEEEALKANKPELIPALRQARQEIAKSYDIEKSLNIGTGDVSASALARALDKGAPFTGNLRTVAEFGNAFPSSVREGARVPASGVSKSEALTSLLLGGLISPIAAALPFASGPTRSMILSPAYQRQMAQPNYGVGMTTKAMEQFKDLTPQQAALIGALQASRSANQ